MFGLGKPRTEFGKWIDREGITQTEVVKASGIGKNAVSKMASDKDYAPKYSTFAKVQQGMDKLGYDIEYDDFW